MTLAGVEEHRALVTAAARYLDQHWPADEVGEQWYDAVDLRILSMGSTCRCVCGQLGARLARHEGYVIRQPLNAPRIMFLPRVTVSGYTALMRSREDVTAMLTYAGESEDSELLEAELELVDVLRKRLEAGDGPSALPRDLLGAFSGRTPSHWWAEEIRTRRRSRV